MKIEGLLIDYVAAGFDPEAFWGLTFRTFDLHMRGAARRAEMQVESANRQAYNTAVLTGLAMVGKVPGYDKVFPEARKKPVKAGAPQRAEVIEANLRLLAVAWGGKAA